MEVKINKEIRDYTENVYFGLSLRQFAFSITACIVAIILYFLLKPYFGIETLSWMCILGASPCAFLGFVKYNGMNAEQFIAVYIQSIILNKRNLTFIPTNYCYEITKSRKKGEIKFENNKKII